MLSKRERLAEVFRRLTVAPPATSAMDALILLNATLTEVEDEFSGLPWLHNQANSPARMYALGQTSSDMSETGALLVSSTHEDVRLSTHGDILIYRRADNTEVFKKYGIRYRPEPDEQPVKTGR